MKVVTEGSYAEFMEDTTKPPFRVYDGEMHENTEIDLAAIVPPEATGVVLRKTYHRWQIMADDLHEVHDRRVTLLATRQRTTVDVLGYSTEGLADP